MLTHADPDILTHVKALSSSTLSTIKSDFHGATSTVHDGLFGKEYYPIEEEGSSDTHSNTHVKAKSRMNAAFYPVKDKIPDVNSPQVQAWVNEIDWAKVPNIPVAPQHPQVKHFPLCPPQGQGNKEACWWSCTGCVAKTDVITCPNSKAWGLTYDDGPSPATWSMMKHLGEMKLTATFFIVGSRVVEFPDVVREQVAQGHHLGMHTWSHAGLTTLTNHQIVAEIKWTEKIIRDVTGLTLKYVRPPYGDTDNRVREILRQMGYTTVIWTVGWDTNDWRIMQNQVQEPEVIQDFKNVVEQAGSIKSQSGKAAGPISLQHDLSESATQLSTRLIPLGQAKGLMPMNLATCLSDNTPYRRGSKLGPGGATEKPNGGDSKGMARGMPGMEEADFASDADFPAGSGSRSERGAKLCGFKQTMAYAAVGLAAVASAMLTV
ncbi:chitin deacetylase [Podila minutissima]|nr:chitin deacetylase [Podila minutissima]